MFNLVLNQQDLNIVMRALGALPLSESLQAFMAIQAQVAKQAMDQNQGAAGSRIPPGPPPIPPAPPTPPEAPKANGTAKKE